MQVSAESIVRVGHLEEHGDFACKDGKNEDGFPTVGDVPFGIPIRLQESRNAADRVASGIRLILVFVVILVLVGCAHNPPPLTPPPPPPPSAPTVAKAKPPLRSGDWIIRNCLPAPDNSCYCHHPAEAIDASGQQQHTVIECR
jgi:hypothetical protein